jgi:hypothetical protein
MLKMEDDNFGNYEEEENSDFYKRIQRESIWKICSICDEKVKLRKEYNKCNSCMEDIERGFQI